MAGEFEKLMKRTKKNIGKLGTSEFGTGSFIFLEEKIAGAKEIRRIFYVSQPVPQKNLEENTPLKISTVAAANKLIRKHHPDAREFAKSSGLCAGFLHKSIDQKQLMLKIVTSKNCSESKLQKGLKELKRKYKGNAFTSFIGYKAGFTAEGIASSDERSETKKFRAETKRITKAAPKAPKKRIEYYKDVISKIEESIRAHITFAKGEEKSIPKSQRPEALNIRDELERASVFLGKYERTISDTKGEVSAFGTLLEEVENAHAALSGKLFGEGDLEEVADQKEKSIREQVQAQVVEQTGIKDIKEGITSRNMNQILDGSIKAGTIAAQTAKNVLDSDAADTVIPGLNIGTSLKKTIDSAGRIKNAKKAQKRMQKQIQKERDLISTKRAKLMLERPNPKTEPEAYNEWTTRLYAIEADIESLEHLVEVQKSIQSKGAFDIIDGTLGIASGALAVSGVGGVASMVVSGTKGAIKGGKIVGDKIRNQKREGKRDKRDSLLESQAANKLLRNVAKRKKKRGEDTSAVEEHIQNTELTEDQQKLLEKMNKIRGFEKNLVMEINFL